MTNLKELTAIITGASSGIGEATALELAGAGVRVMLAARREDRLQALQGKIEQLGGVAQIRVTDVTSREDVEGLVADTVQAFGRVDVMFNNAGVMLLSPLEKLKVDEWDRMVDVNIKGVLYGMAAVLPQMRQQGSGHIINTASVAGLKVFPAAAVYCGTKHAVRAISEGLRMEFGDQIRSTIISPGAVATELADHISDQEVKAQMAGVYEIAIPSEAVARAVRYAIEQPASVDINEIVVRPTAQTL